MTSITSNTGFLVSSNPDDALLFSVKYVYLIEIDLFCAVLIDEPLTEHIFVVLVQ